MLFLLRCTEGISTVPRRRTATRVKKGSVAENFGSALRSTGATTCTGTGKKRSLPSRPSPPLTFWTDPLESGKNQICSSRNHQGGACFCRLAAIECPEENKVLYHRYYTPYTLQALLQTLPSYLLDNLYLKGSSTLAHKQVGALNSATPRRLNFILATAPPEYPVSVHCSTSNGIGTCRIYVASKAELYAQRDELLRVLPAEMMGIGVHMECEIEALDKMKDDERIERYACEFLMAMQRRPWFTYHLTIRPVERLKGSMLCHICRDLSAFELLNGDTFKSDTLSREPTLLCCHSSTPLSSALVMVRKSRNMQSCSSKLCIGSRSSEPTTSWQLYSRSNTRTLRIPGIREILFARTDSSSR